MSLLDPLTHALAAVLATAHAALTSAGADPTSGPTWVLSIAAVVVVVRVALLPLVVHNVRNAHASARARPQLDDLAKRYRHRKDAASVRAMMDEQRRIKAQHGVSSWGCLSVLAQLPVWVALYQLLSNVAIGHSVGAMTAGLVASLGGASVLGVHLAERGYFGAGVSHLAVVAGLACLAAVLSFVTQKFLVLPNTVTTAMPDSLFQAQHFMPALAAVSLLVAGGIVPVALIVYWVFNTGWTSIQSAVVWRWFPTPGTAAAARS